MPALGTVSSMLVQAKPQSRRCVVVLLPMNAAISYNMTVTLVHKVRTTRYKEQQGQESGLPVVVALVQQCPPS